MVAAPKAAPSFAHDEPRKRTRKRCMRRRRHPEILDEASVFKVSECRSRKVEVAKIVEVFGDAEDKSRPLINEFSLRPKGQWETSSTVVKPLSSLLHRTVEKEFAGIGDILLS